MSYPQDTILVDMLNGPDHSKNTSYCVTDPDVSIVVRAAQQGI